ncbi:uncharacterized protein [Odocoileus virginianus]|uniref:Uncharacterized protein n=1 Tax=Odocoileus virginianus TaxID=9874 RepID=A0ABM4IM62_ODOVR
MIRGGAGRSHPGRSVSLHTAAAATRGRPRAGQLRPATREEEAAAAAAAVVGPGHAHRPGGRRRGSAVWPGAGGAPLLLLPRGAREPAEPPGRRQVALGHNRLPRARGRSPPFSPFLQGRDIPLKPGRREPPAPVGAFSLALSPRLSPLLPALGRAARCAFGGPSASRPPAEAGVTVRGARPGRSFGPRSGPFPGLVPNTPHPEIERELARLLDHSLV